LSACLALATPAFGQSCTEVQRAIGELDNLALRLRAIEFSLRGSQRSERRQLEADRCETVRRISEIERRAAASNCPMQLMRVRDAMRGLSTDRCTVER
jgi:hypothetical protein